MSAPMQAVVGRGRSWTPPGDAIKLIAHTMSSSAVGSDQTSQFTLKSDGDVASLMSTGSPSPSINADEWHEDNTATVGADYDVRASVTAGTDPTGGALLDTWLGLGSDRFWSNASGFGDGIKTSTLTFEFRLAAEPGEIIKTVTGHVIAAFRLDI